MQLNQLTIRNDLSEQEKRELLALLAERKARGLTVPTLDKNKIVGMNEWHIDENGFFRRNSAGKPYDPAGEQLSFISSQAVFVGLQGGRGCLGAESKIDGVPIGDLTQPSWVPSIGRISMATRSFVKGTDKLYKVTTQSGLTVSVTLQHRFLTTEGWETLSLINVGDFILTGETSYDIKFECVSSIQFDREGEFYDITVPFAHNYLANGIFHHNSGKTSAGAQKALRKIKEGRTGIVVNPDLENFKTSTWPELRDWIPWNMVIPKHRIRRSASWDVTRPFSIVFVNGAVLYCRGLRDPEAGRGHNVNWLWYDEARRDKTGIAWKNAIAGVRIGDNTQRWLTTTPAGRDSWIAALFDRKEIPDEVIELLKEVPDMKNRELIESYHVSLDENRKNLDPVFYATLVSSFPSGYLRKREVDGIAANEEGALGDRVWFTHNPTTGVSHILNIAPEWRGRIRYYDLAASEKKVGTDPDETVGSLVSYDDKKENFCIEDQVGGHWLWDQILENIRNTAMKDGQAVIIYIEQEPASGGKNQVAAIANFLKPLGFTVRAHDPKKDGDRVEAANHWFAEAAQGHWWIVKGKFNEPFFAELDSFPDSQIHDDRITAISGGRFSIAPIRRWSSIKFLHMGQKLDSPKEENKVGSWGKPLG